MRVLTRLPADQRRAAIVDAALRVFSAGSYTGSTTADIAREAGVSEPILYRHFASKRDLWFACLDEAWLRFRQAIEVKFAELGAEQGVLAIAQTGRQLRKLRVLMPNLWIQGVTEASEDPEATREAMLNAVREQIDPYIAAGNAVIDDIIDPRETRPTIVKALRMARNKRVEKPPKRHGVMPV